MMAQEIKPSLGHARTRTFTALGRERQQRAQAFMEEHSKSRVLNKSV
jgi:hypothetical protein